MCGFCETKRVRERRADLSKVVDAVAGERREREVCGERALGVVAERLERRVGAVAQRGLVELLWRTDQLVVVGRDLEIL